MFAGSSTNPYPDACLYACQPPYSGPVLSSTFRFNTLREMHAALTASSSMHLALPPSSRAQPGGWVLAVFEFESSARATAAAGRVVQRGTSSSFVWFEKRDWERLLSFCSGASDSDPPPRDTALTIPESLPPANLPVVMLVEDERMSRELIQSFLQDQGWPVRALASAEEAIPMLDERVFSLFILDWTLPGMGGLELCSVIRGRSYLATVPVLFLTANHSERAESEALAAGANDYIHKPVEAAEFLARVQALLSRTGQFPRVA